MRAAVHGLAALAVACLLQVSTALGPNPDTVLGGSPIWHPDNLTTQFVLFRSPVFTVPSWASSSELIITARQSPSESRGTLQSKLNGAFKLFINGVLVSSGPGHNIPSVSQAVVRVPLFPFLRIGGPNIVAVQSFFANGTSDVPRLQAVLTIANASDSLNVTATGVDWTAWAGDAFMNPSGNVDQGSKWYSCPNENLDLRVYPVGWNMPNFVPDDSWRQAVVQPAFQYPLYLEASQPPVSLSRKACTISSLTSQLTCGQAAEQSTVDLVCSYPGASGQPAVISAVTFASYGTPQGTCLGPTAGNNFTRNATCDSPYALANITALCVGKPSCSIPVDNAFFGGDPCHLTAKHLAVAVICSSANAGKSRYLVDYGQEVMGGVNFTFWTNSSSGGAAPYAPGTQLTVLLGEELNADGSVMCPGRQGNYYNSSWTLAASPADAGITQHEFIQFRYAEVIGSPVPLTPDNARAWVMVHPVGGTGESPWDLPCAETVSNAAAYGSGPIAPRQPVAVFKSDNAGLDAVFNLTANTAVATTLDINVDSQTRQRDLCHIDALITGLEQYAIFSPGDYEVQRRTFLNAFGNDSGIWGSWYEFKASGALMAFAHALETGDLSVALTTWSNDDLSINADGPNGTWFMSAQFYAGVRYFNLSGSGLLHFPDGCGGSWACDPLADWPTQTRDGYDVNPDNSEDAIRNGIGALAIAGLSRVATWLGYTDAAARYAAMSQSIVSSMNKLLLRYNTTAPEAYFVDGAVGNSTNHAAIHSTLYAVSAGAADNNATLATMLTAYLQRRDIGVSSCMTGRWYIEALYRLGIWEPAAADFALELLSRTTFPSWGNMIQLGATTTLEAWCPDCKWNTDWAHPWCASPAFLIPRLLLGVQPLEIAWSRFRIAPQPSNVTTIVATVPTPNGAIPVNVYSSIGNVTVSFVVPSGSTAEVCLAAAGDAGAVQQQAADANNDVLFVDGAAVQTTAMGRFLCTAVDVASGTHVASRRPQASTS